MKGIFTISVALFTLSQTFAQPRGVPAKAGSTFGKKITASNAITVNELQTLLADKSGASNADIKVKGVVTDVCTMEGCWIKIKSPDGKIMVNMKDHTFKVPLALNGKTVVIEGVAQEKLTNIEQLKHYATDAGKSKEEIAAIKEPKKEIVMDAKGVLVL